MRNPYLPQEARVVGLKNLTQDVKLIEFNLKEEIDFSPGQFLLISILGFGECPIAISSSPLERPYQICVRKVGIVTHAIHRLKVGERFGIRGPYGNGFDLERLRKQNLVIIGGGTGIFPLRSLIRYIGKRREEFKEVFILYGARSPRDLLFRDEYKRWERFSKVLITVDKAGTRWRGRVGVVTHLLDEIKLSRDFIAITCGPPIMYKFVIQKLLKAGLRREKIFLSLERRMKCGIGTCQHCVFGNKYVCLDGPIFSYKEIALIPDAI
jgi:sulfite reductase subunit B